MNNHSHGKGKRPLSREDRELWDKVKKTASPLTSNLPRFEDLMKAEVPVVPVTLVHETGNLEDEIHPQRKNNRRQATILRPTGSGRPSGPHQIILGAAPLDNILDQKTIRKISKGRTPIDSRVDLHGMTQVQAHGRLYDVLEQAWRSHKRVILVITGKGRNGEGILRQSVPRWLAEPAFKAITSGFSEAQVVHGGAGALYVRIKRQRGGP